MLPENTDIECRELCEAINGYADIETIESCCGHGRNPFMIHFKAKTLEALPPLIYWFDFCHCGSCSWKISVNTDCSKSPVYFTIKGPIGELAYQQSHYIAKLLKKANR